jgi:hypothetical protein
MYFEIKNNIKTKKKKELNQQQIKGNLHQSLFSYASANSPDLKF